MHKRKIEFEMKGDRLVIKKEGKWNWNDGWRRSEVDIYVTMKDIEELSVSGSGLIESDGKLDTEDIRLSVSGSGDMDLDISSDEMDLRISGSGSIQLNESRRIHILKEDFGLRVCVDIGWRGVIH